MPGRRSLDAVVEQRVDQVLTFIVQGFPKHRILRHLAENGVTAPRSQSWYVSQATRRLKVLAAPRREIELGTLLARLEMLWVRALAAGDVRAALAVLHERGEVLGLRVLPEEAGKSDEVHVVFVNDWRGRKPTGRT